MSYNASAKIYCVKARLKRWVFKSRQKDAVFAEAWMDAGRLFHTAGLAWLNAGFLETVFNLIIGFTVTASSCELRLCQFDPMWLRVKVCIALDGTQQPAYLLLFTTNPVVYFVPLAILSCMFLLPRTKTDFERRAFSSVASQIWNHKIIPTAIRVSPSLDSFKHHLKSQNSLLCLAITT